MRYVSEMVESAPTRQAVDMKVEERVKQMCTLGYHLLSRSYVGKAWAVLVFEADAVI